MAGRSLLGEKWKKREKYAQDASYVGKVARISTGRAKTTKQPTTSTPKTPSPNKGCKENEIFNFGEKPKPPGIILNNDKCYFAHELWKEILVKYSKTLWNELSVHQKKEVFVFNCEILECTSIPQPVMRTE